MVSLLLLRQVEYPDSAVRPIFVLEVIVSLHQYAAFRTEFIIHSKPAINHHAGSNLLGFVGETFFTSPLR